MYTPTRNPPEHPTELALCCAQRKARTGRFHPCLSRVGGGLLRLGPGALPQPGVSLDLNTAMQIQFICSHSSMTGASPYSEFRVRQMGRRGNSSLSSRTVCRGGSVSRRHSTGTGIQSWLAGGPEAARSVNRTSPHVTRNMRRGPVSDPSAGDDDKAIEASRERASLIISGSKSCLPARRVNDPVCALSRRWQNHAIVAGMAIAARARNQHNNRAAAAWQTRRGHSASKTRKAQLIEYLL
jgi:hypothetical protein